MKERWGRAVMYSPVIMRTGREVPWDALGKCQHVLYCIRDGFHAMTVDQVQQWVNSRTGDVPSEDSFLQQCRERGYRAEVWQLYEHGAWRIQ